MLVFVYGTLKRGHGNHVVLSNGGASYLGEDTTVHKYKFLDLGYYPAVVPPAKDALDTYIEGELYSVNDLVALDSLEGYPHLFTRKEIILTSGEEAWMYMLNAEEEAYAGYPLVQKGRWIG